MGSSSTVGIYIDDAPIGSSGIYNSTNVLTFDLMPYDVERIEVLRGPQGTLYGASSIGGQLKYVTVAPALDEFEGRIGAEALDVTDGSGTDFNYGARISFPLVKDSLGMSLSYARRDLPAYIDNVQTGETDVNEGTQEGARLALLWQPSDGTSVTPVGAAAGGRQRFPRAVHGGRYGHAGRRRTVDQPVSRRALREPVRPVFRDARASSWDRPR